MHINYKEKNITEFVELKREENEVLKPRESSILLIITVEKLVRKGELNNSSM